MNNTLYDRIINAPLNESLRDVFFSLNLDGYRFVERIKCDDKTKDGIIKYVAYYYSVQSEFFRNTKQKEDKAKAICKKLNLDISNKIIKEVVSNNNQDVNSFISWWLKETAHPLFIRVVSGIDLESEKLQIARDGLLLSFTGDADEIEKFTKRVSKDSTLKTKAFIDSVVIRNQIEKDISELDRIGYGVLEKIVKEDLPNELKKGESFAEYISRTSKKNSINDTNKRKNNIAIQQESN